MGELILLEERRADRSRPTGAKPAFFFDVGCPFSYLSAELVERTLGDVEWVPTSARAVGGELSLRETEALRHRAEARAAALRLPLVWPEPFPSTTPCALRVASFAIAAGGGARFVLAACRLAFCGGFDLDDPETLAEAAAAAGVSLRGCFSATGDATLDAPLAATAAGLRRRGVEQLPAVRVGRHWFEGDTALTVAEAVLRGASGAELAPGLSGAPRAYAPGPPPGA